MVLGGENKLKLDLDVPFGKKGQFYCDKKYKVDAWLPIINLFLCYGGIYKLSLHLTKSRLKALHDDGPTQRGGKKVVS